MNDVSEAAGVLARRQWASKSKEERSRIMTELQKKRIYKKKEVKKDCTDKCDKEVHVH